MYDQLTPPIGDSIASASTDNFVGVVEILNKRFGGKFTGSMQLFVKIQATLFSGTVLIYKNKIVGASAENMSSGKKIYGIEALEEITNHMLCATGKINISTYDAINFERALKISPISILRSGIDLDEVVNKIKSNMPVRIIERAEKQKLPKDAKKIKKGARPSEIKPVIKIGSEETIKPLRARKELTEILKGMDVKPPTTAKEAEDVEKKPLPETEISEKAEEKAKSEKELPAPSVEAPSSVAKEAGIEKTEKIAVPPKIEGIKEAVPAPEVVVQKKVEEVKAEAIKEEEQKAEATKAEEARGGEIRIEEEKGEIKIEEEVGPDVQKEFMSAILEEYKKYEESGALEIDTKPKELPPSLLIEEKEQEVAEEPEPVKEDVLRKKIGELGVGGYLEEYIPKLDERTSNMRDLCTEYKNLIGRMDEIGGLIDNLSREEMKITDTIMGIKNVDERIDIEIKEREKLVGEKKKIKDKIAEIEREGDERDDKFYALMDSRTILNLSVDEKPREIIKIEGELKKRKSSYNKNLKEIKKIEEDIKTLFEKKEKIDDKIKNLEYTRKTARDKLNEITNNRCEIRKRIDDLLGEKDTLKGEIEMVRSGKDTLAEMKEKLENLESQSEDKLSELSELEGEISKLKAKNEENKEKYEELLSKSDNLKKSIEKMEADADDIRSGKDSLSGINQNIENLRNENNSLSLRLREFEDRIETESVSADAFKNRGEVEKALKGIEDEEGAVEFDRINIIKTKRDLKKKLDEIAKKRSELKETYYKMSREQGGSGEDYDEISRKIDRIDKQLESAENKNDKDVSKYNTAHLKDKLVEMSAAHEEIETKIASEDKKLSDLDEKARSLAVRYNELLNEMKKYGPTVAKSAFDRESVEKQMEEIKNKIKDNDSRIDELEAERRRKEKAGENISVLKDKIAESSNDLKNTDEESTLLKEKIDGIENKINVRFEDKKRIEEDLDGKESEIKKIKDRIEDLSSRMGKAGNKEKIEKDIKQVDEKIKNMLKDIKNIEKEEEESDKKNQEIDTQIREAEKERDRIADKISKRDNEKKDMEKDAEDIDEKNAMMQDAIDDFMHRYNEAKQTLYDLIESRSHFGSIVASYKKRIEA